MAEVVGTAYVRIRAITTGLSSDIKDGLDSGMAGMDKDVERNITEKVTRKVKDGMGEAGDEGGKSFTQRLRSSMRKGMSDTDKDTSKRFKGMLDNLKKFKLPGRFWLAALAIPALGGALKLAASYIITLVGQLGYIVEAALGAGAALGGIAAAVGLAAVPLMLAFKADTEAMDAFRESAQLTTDAWLEMGAVVQSVMLPALDAAYEKTQILIPAFTTFGLQVGTILGETATRLADFLTTSSSIGMLGNILSGAADVFQNLMDVVVSLVQALLPLLEAVMPLAVRMSESMAIAAQNFADFVTAGSESGALSDTLTLWYDRAESIGRSLWNIIEALWEIFRVGAEVVAPQFKTLEDTTQGWVDFLRSAEGQSTLDRIFENALPVAQAFNDLMGDIVEMIVKPLLGGDTEGVVTFLESLRTDWLPLLQDLAEALSANLGPNLQELVSGFIELITEMAESGALGTMTMLLGDLIRVLVELFEIPGIGEFLGIMLTIVTVLGLLAGPLGAIIGLAEVLLPVVISLFPAFGLLAAPLATLVGIILAVIAVIAAIIVIWKNWDKIVAGAKKIWENFTEWIGEAWETIKDFFGGIGDWIAEAWTAFIDFFQNLPTAIGDALSNMGTAIADFFSGIATAISEWVASIPGMMLEAATALWQWIVDAVPQALSALGNFAIELFAFIVMLPLNIGTMLVEGSIALYKWIIDAVPKVLEWLGNMYVTIYTWILTTIANIIQWGVQLGASIIQWVIDAARAFPGKLAEIWNAIINWIQTTVSNIINAVVRFRTAFLDWISEAATSAPGKLAEFAQKVWDWITDFVGGLPERFINAITSFLSFGTALFNSIKDGLTSALGSFGDWAGSLLTKIKEALINAAPDWLKGPLRSLFGGGNPQQPTGPPSSTRAVATVQAGVRAGGPNLLGAATPAFAGGGGAGIAPMAFGVQSLMTAAVPPTTVGPANQFTTGGFREFAPINLVVQIGETDITDMIDARISSNDRATAQALWVRRR